MPISTGKSAELRGGKLLQGPSHLTSERSAETPKLGKLVQSQTMNHGQIKP